MIKIEMGGTEIDLEVAINEILKQFQDKTEKGTKKAILKGAQIMRNALETNSPVQLKKETRSVRNRKKNGTFETKNTIEHLRDGWKIRKVAKQKYAQKISNSKVVSLGKNGPDVPLTVMIEYGKNRKPFIKKTYQSKETEVLNAIKTELEKEIKK